MLVRLFGSNFRSLKAPFELSMVAADLTREQDRDRGIFSVSIRGMPGPLRLLRTVAIYGPNASGKSTVLMAANALRWLAISSSRVSEVGESIPPYEPFSLCDDSRDAPIEIGCDIVFKKSLLRYEVSFTKKVIQREVLTLLDGESEVKLIDRRSQGEIRGELIASSDANQLYVREMQSNVTVLSKLAQHGPARGSESVRPYFLAIRESLRYEDYADASVSYRVSSEDERFADDEEYRRWIMQHLIRAADVGICDVRTRRENFEVPDFIKEQLAKSDDKIVIPDKRVVVSFLHSGAKDGAIDFALESAGTRKLFHIANDWWTLSHEPVTILGDELGAGLHPRLLSRIIRAVNDPPSKRVRSQLIFTTHDTGLLESQDGQSPALRRDQVYLTSKGARGDSELYSLAEFKTDARPVHNIRKRYLSGLYGAIPAVEKLSL